MFGFPTESCSPSDRNRHGRVLTADPAGSGTNWYAYVGGDPINRNDPRGLFASAGGGQNDPEPFCLVYPEHQACAPWPVNYSPSPGGKTYTTPPPTSGDSGIPIVNGTVPIVTSTFLPYEVCPDDPLSGSCVLIGTAPIDDSQSPLAKISDTLIELAQEIANMPLPPISISGTSFASPMEVCPVCVAGIGVGVTFFPPSGATIGSITLADITNASNWGFTPINVEIGFAAPGTLSAASLTVWNTTSPDKARSVICGLTYYFVPVLVDQNVSVTWATSGGNVLSGTTLTSRGPSLTIGGGYTSCP
jgi:hypothetical protein